MCEENARDGFDDVIALEVDPSLKAGKIGIKDG